MRAPSRIPTIPTTSTVSEHDPFLPLLSTLISTVYFHLTSATNFYYLFLSVLRPPPLNLKAKKRHPIPILFFLPFIEHIPHSPAALHELGVSLLLKTQFSSFLSNTYHHFFCSVHLQLSYTFFCFRYHFHFFSFIIDFFFVLIPKLYKILWIGWIDWLFYFLTKEYCTNIF